MSREAALVELVSLDGKPIGATTVEDAHSAPGRLHRAFSVLLFDPGQRILLQRRAAAKTRFALRWGNACCGHPVPGQTVAAAAAQRLREELGLHSIALTPAGVYVYHAADATNGRVEYEYDHVLIGRIAADAPMRPDPTEVAQLRWIGFDKVCAEIATDPGQFAPWLAGVLATVLATGPDAITPAESTGGGVDG